MSEWGGKGIKKRKEKEDEVKPEDGEEEKNKALQTL